MAWNLKTKVLESCSCAALCPCVLGPAKPDQGWCSGVLGFQVVQGNSDGVDLSGANVVMHFELPGDFLGGIEKAKLYLDSSLSDKQRGEIDAIFHGEKGGLWEGMKGTIAKWLPSQVTKVEFTGGDTPGLKVAGAGQVTLTPFNTPDGKPTMLHDAPILAAFSMGAAHLGMASDTRFSDPDLRSWESLGSGSTSEAEWSG